jgi:hypothetical protein
MIKLKELLENLPITFISEMKLPKGFTSADVESVDDFLKDELNGLTEAVDDADVKDIDIKDLMAKRLKEPSERGEGEFDLADKPSKMIHASNIKDEHGNPVNEEELKKKIMQRPAKILDKNAKIGKSGKGKNLVFFDLTLPSYQGLFVDETTGEFKVVKTCPAAGICKKFCYAAKGGYIMFPASSLNASRVVNFLMNDPEGFKRQILQEINDAKNRVKEGYVVIRWHDSGDFLSQKYLDLAYEVARETPTVVHYAYTKQIPMVLKSDRPKNFVFNFSFGGVYDDLIDPTKHKYSRVVPSELFKDLGTKTKDTIIFKPENLEAFKQRVADTYHVSKDSVITYDELMDKPYDPHADHEAKWNVLVWKGHGDDAAMRSDVLGTLLLIH